MMDPMTFLVVGGAVMAPTLLDFETPTVPTATGLVPGDPRSVLAGHRAAIEFYRSTAILGVTETKSSKEGLFFNTRLVEVMRALIPTRGSIDGSPGFAKLSPAECFELVRITVEAVGKGINEDTPSDGYVISRETIPLGLQFVSQRDPFNILVNNGTLNGGVPEGLEEPTRLANAIGEARAQAFLALRDGIPNPDAFDARPLLRAVFTLVNEIDSQGISFDPDIGVDEIFESVGDSAGALPGRVADVVTGIVGDAIGAVLLSRPVLLVLAGLVVYRVVRG